MCVNSIMNTNKQFSVKQLDHVNIRSSNVQNLEEFYCGVLGFELLDHHLHSGTRHFGFGSNVMLHVVPSDIVEQSEVPAIEHFAFVASNIDDLIARLERASVPFRRIERGPITAIDFRDPDGNRVHFDFQNATEV